MIEITYFGFLKEALGVADETLEWTAGSSEALLETLRTRGELWETTLAPNNIFRVVVNEEIHFGDVEIKAGDKVALLPPVTGG